MDFVVVFISIRFQSSVVEFYVVLSGFLSLLPGFTGFLPDLYRNFTIFLLFSRIYKNFYALASNFIWVLLGCIGFYWVLPSFTGFYWVFTGFYLVLLGFTGFYWVLPSFTGFLLGFT